MKDLLIQIDNIGKAIHPTEDVINIIPSLSEDKSIIHIFCNSKEKIMFSRCVLNKHKTDCDAFNLSMKCHQKKIQVHVMIIQTSDKRFLTIKKNYEKENMETFWQQFTKSFPGGLVFINPKMNILELTQATIHLLKFRDSSNISYSKENLIGKSILDVCPKNLQKIIKEKISTKSGSYVELEGSFLSFSFQDLYQESKITGTCLFIFDHTEIVKLHSALDHQKQNLVNSARLASLGEMAAGVAHEINNPLGIISMRANFLKKLKKDDKLTDEKFYKFLDQIESSVNRVASIVTGLRTIARDPSQDGFSTSNIMSIITSVVDLASERLKHLSIHLDLSLVDQNIAIHCNPVQISQVLINLINNSIDAIQHEKEKFIKLEVKNEHNYITVRVTDSGPKIDRVIAEKIMQPFFTTKPVGEGTGLGLSISKGILNSHQGDLYLDIEHENNSFVLMFPSKI
ncbi:MAG: sensor histidine kinase [Oligoflexales bacterium]